MKTILLLIAILVSGCATTNQPEPRVTYRIENGFLRVRPAGYGKLPEPQTDTLPEPPQITTSGEPAEIPPIPATIQKSTRSIRVRMKKIHILTE